MPWIPDEVHIAKTDHSLAKLISVHDPFQYPFYQGWERYVPSSLETWIKDWVWHTMTSFESVCPTD